MSTPVADDLQKLLDSTNMGWFALAFVALVLYSAGFAILYMARAEDLRYYDQRLVYGAGVAMIVANGSLEVLAVHRYLSLFPAPLRVSAVIAVALLVVAAVATIAAMAARARSRF